MAVDAEAITQLARSPIPLPTRVGPEKTAGRFGQVPTIATRELHHLFQRQPGHRNRRVWALAPGARQTSASLRILGKMQLENLVFDATDPRRLGRFWEAVVGGERLTDNADAFETRLSIPGGPTIDLCFQRVPMPSSRTRTPSP